ncbi:hypothetical protein MIMGU_mgv1a000665mg [Erythranthe guttata]|uniref:Uncharacterized protein n=1 Tax=Erythranthe guttata TaxID=4155 RepID=A0A022RHC7_ERYGU|nr:hypothetical protein MIMGU_mgv1a000665mg [Erythranthe guttata]
MKLTSNSNNSMLFFLIFLFSISENALVSKSTNLRQRCLHDQRRALIKLQQDILNNNASSITFDDNSYPKVENWDEKVDCCSWEGVHCDNYGHVVSLNLSYSQISGRIEAVFDLIHLQNLSLARNNFQLSPIPSGFEKLANLTHLNLSYSCFSDQIPPGISRLEKLVSLDLSTISFCELPPTFNDPDSNHVFHFEELHRLRLEKPNLDSFFRDLRNLTEVYLDYVDLSAQGTTWSRALSGLHNLKVLSLPHCRLSGPIDTSFKNLKSLNFINLEGNNLSSEVPRFLPGFTDLQVSLQMVSLYETNFTGKLPDSIGNLKAMTNLLLYTCNFYGSIPRSLANLTSVAEIDISYNKFEGTIPAFGDFSVPKLQDLRLSFNLLTGTIEPRIFTLPSLKILYLNDNRLSGVVGEFSASSSVLEKVYLNGNNLSGGIPRSISEIPSLSFVSLAANEFTGSMQMDAFQNLENLTSLDLSFNSLTIGADKQDLVFPMLEELKLSRCNLTEFPAFLKNLEQLRTLNLSNNQIRGPVPKWLWTSSLNELDLSENEVDFPNGHEENGTFSPLGKLTMRSCNVFEFPEFLKVTDSLWYLDLSGNKIEGKVPSWIWKSSLQYVNISHNSLDSMEEFYPNITLDLLATLDIRGNSLRGSLPKGICKLSSLSILDASHNKLNGSIPECLGMMVSLSVLNLQRNKYTRIPSNFAPASKLRSLNINGNLLEGNLPRSIANCKMLEVLDLGNNMITDTFPFWMDKLPDLKVLVLKNNKFYGQIQLPATRNFSLPKLGIIDLSSNNFTGDLPREFLESLDEMLMNRKSKSAAFKTIGQYEYYQDSVTIMSKGYEMVLVRILTIFVSLDLSNNRFVGKIPEEIGELKSLVVLNLSRNGFEGRIQPSLGDLVELESLDLSQNKLSGNIPQQLTGLTFMSAFNISYNNLTGSVPRGNQFETYTNDSYIGNVGLCGQPLSKKCTSDDPATQPPLLSDSVRLMNDSVLGKRWSLGREFGAAEGGEEEGIAEMAVAERRRGKLKYVGGSVIVI